MTVRSWRARMLAGVCTFTLCIGTAAAQQDEGPILKPKAKPKPAGATLLVMCDLACDWKLDGDAKGRIEAGGAAKVKVGLGQHVVDALTEDGLDQVEQLTKVAEEGQTVLTIKLQPVREARLKADQEAHDKAVREAREKSEQEARDKAPLGPVEILNSVKEDDGSELCLDVSKGDLTAGAVLNLWPCYGGSNQRFTFTHDGQITIAGLCVDALGGTSHPYADVGIWNCLGTANQQWSRDPSGRILGYYFEGSGRLCLTGSVSGSHVQVAACGTSGRQFWSFRPAPGAPQTAPQ